MTPVFVTRRLLGTSGEAVETYRSSPKGLCGPAAVGAVLARGIRLNGTKLTEENHLSRARDCGNVTDHDLAMIGEILSREDLSDLEKDAIVGGIFAELGLC
jgi:hypothetical protein